MTTTSDVDSTTSSVETLSFGGKLVFLGGAFFLTASSTSVIDELLSTLLATSVVAIFNIIELKLD